MTASIDIEPLGLGTLRNGTCHSLEDEATRLILQSLEGVTDRRQKDDILTPWKDKHKKKMEILTRSGAQVDPSTMRGQFSKAYNPDKPHLNSRDCPTRAPRMSNTWDPESVVTTGMLSQQMASVFGVDSSD